MSEASVPLVSVITVARNAAGTIASTLESVRAQRDVSVEHIVIDGASNDETVDVIRRFEHGRLHWISEPDQGIYDAMNKGIALSQGEWLLFLGADDVLAGPSTLAKVFSGRELSAYDFVCGQSRYQHGRICIPRLGWRTQVFNTIQHQSAFYRHRLFDNFRYRTDIPIVADYEMNFLIYARRYPAIFLDICVAVCGNHGVSQTTSQISAQLNIFRIRRRHMNPFSNIFFLAAGLCDLALARFARPARSD